MTITVNDTPAALVVATVEDLVDCPSCKGACERFDHNGDPHRCGACDSTGEVLRGHAEDPAWCDTCGVYGLCPECER